MSEVLPAPVIGILGKDNLGDAESRGCYLWPPGYAASLEAAGGKPQPIDLPATGKNWDDILAGVQGILFIGDEPTTARQGFEQERLCQLCLKQGIPILGVDHGLHVLNTAHGGGLHLDLAREQPQALQHRHPPEKGLRHAIMVEPGTKLAGIYGEGEIVVNSEHRKGVAKLARGFRVSARALDGIVECIEFEQDHWFAMGVQWHPASSSASGLDIQLFRALVDASALRIGALSAAA